MSISKVDNNQYWYIFDTEKKQNDTEISTTTNEDINKDAFLNLLVTQLKYQDPLNPVDDKEFLGQMAQFSILEQIKNMDESIKESQEKVLNTIDQINISNSYLHNDIIEELKTLNGAFKAYIGREDE